MHEPVGIQATAAHDTLNHEGAEVLALEAFGSVLVTRALRRRCGILLLPRHALSEHTRARLAPAQSFGRLLAEGAHHERRF